MKVLTIVPSGIAVAYPAVNKSGVPMVLPRSQSPSILMEKSTLQRLISIEKLSALLRKIRALPIEKGFQIDGKVIRNLAYHPESLAMADAIDAETGIITFREQN